MNIIPYEAVAETFLVILAVVGGITAILTLREKIMLANKPYKDRYERHNASIESNTADIEALKKDIAELKAENRIQTETHLLLLNHILEHNHEDQLREQRDFIYRYLNER